MSKKSTRFEGDTAPPARKPRILARTKLDSTAPTDSGEESVCPWVDLDEEGNGLTVDDFITTLTIRLGNALRRTITVPYADQFGMTVSEWRILSVLAHAETLPFAELVVLSTADKALVSRTLRLLESRGWVSISTLGHSPRKRLICTITPAGRVLYDKIMPIARRRQAAIIRMLTPEERKVVFFALRKLLRHCTAEAEVDTAD